MTPGTRSRALAKLVLLERKIGYPDSWRHYNGLTIKPDDLVGNLQRGQKYRTSTGCRASARPPTAASG